MSLKKFINYEYTLRPKNLANVIDSHMDHIYEGFLQRSILSLNGMGTDKFKITVKIMDDNIYAIRIRRKYQKGSIESSIIIFNLNPGSNTISISKSEDFLTNGILLRVVIVLLSKKLNKNGLKIETREIKITKDFWEIVKGKEDRIKELKFEYKSANLKGSSKAIPTKLRMLFEMLGDNSNSISMNAPRGFTLKSVNKFNKILNPLVTFSKTSNSNILIKFIDEKKFYNTSKNYSVTIYDNFNFDKIGDDTESNFNLEILS